MIKIFLIIFFQAEILLKGLSKWQNEVTPRVIVSGSLTFADNLKGVVEELQKVYQAAIAKIKGLPSKAVKVCHIVYICRRLATIIVYFVYYIDYLYYHMIYMFCPLST